VGQSDYVFRIFKRLFTTSLPWPKPAAADGMRLAKEARYVVEVDDREVICRHPDGRVDRVAWEDLDEVIVETNDTGPWGMDVLWLLLSHRAHTACVIPLGATGEKKLLDALQRLPEFDNEAMIAAMSCADNRSFLCWRRANPGPRRDEEMV
jgi:hypothetical protein